MYGFQLTEQFTVFLISQSCKGKVSLTVGHAVGMTPVKDRSPDLSKFPLSIGPPVEVHHPQKSPPGYPSYNNDDNMEPNQSSSSLKVSSSGMCSVCVVIGCIVVVYVWSSMCGVVCGVCI